MGRTRYFNRLAREDQLREFLAWLPSELHAIPGIDWSLLPGEVMAYFVCIVGSTPDASYLAIAIVTVGAAVRTASLVKMLSALRSLFYILREKCGMKHISELNQERLWRVFATKTERTLGRTMQLRVYSSVSTKYVPSYLQRLTQDERRWMKKYALPTMPRGFLKQQSGVMRLRGKLRIANHLTVTEVKAKIEGAKSAWLRTRWNIVYTVLVNPQPVSEIAASLDVSSDLVQQVISAYNRGGPNAIETKGSGGRRAGYLTLEEKDAFLAPFVERAEAGDVATLKEIKHAFEMRVGQKVHETTIYRMLDRHGWHQFRVCLTMQEEVVFLAPFFARAQAGHVATFQEVKQALEAQEGQKVHETIIARMLDRHGWHQFGEA